MPMSAIITPPAVSKEAISIPNARSRRSPDQVTTIRIIVIATPAVNAVFFFSEGVLSPVRLANMARFPMGFVIASIAMVNVISWASLMSEFHYYRQRFNVNPHQMESLIARRNWYLDHGADPGIKRDGEEELFFLPMDDSRIYYLST